MEVGENEDSKEESKHVRPKMQLRRVRDNKGSRVLCNGRVEN